MTRLWIGLATVGAVVEGVALFNRVKGDTLSEHIWALRARPVAKHLVAPALGWLAWHFLVDGPKEHPVPRTCCGA